MLASKMSPIFYNFLSHGELYVQLSNWTYLNEFKILYSIMIMNIKGNVKEVGGTYRKHGDVFCSLLLVLFISTRILLHGHDKSEKKLSPGVHK